MVKSDPTKKKTTATQTLPETLKDGTESASDFPDQSGKSTQDSNRDGKGRAVDIDEGHEPIKGAENSSKDIGVISDSPASPDSSHQSNIVSNKETAVAINTDELHTRTIAEDQYESISRTGEKSEVDVGINATERSNGGGEDMDGDNEMDKVRDSKMVKVGNRETAEVDNSEMEYFAKVGKIETGLAENRRVEVGHDSDSNTGRLAQIGEVDSADERSEDNVQLTERDEEVMKKPVIVRIPYGGDDEVDEEWMAMDQRVVGFLDDGEWSISTFSEAGDSDEEIVQAMAVSGTPLKNMKRIETKLEAMIKGKQRPRSKSPAKSEGSSKSKKVGIQLPTDSSEWRKADYTSHGITSLPPQLFKSKDGIQELLMSGNNIRFIQPEIKKLTNLVKIDISKNGIRSNSPNDFGGLPLEMQQLTNLQQLCASECNFRYVPPVIWKIPSLRYLDISRNKIHVLPPDVGNLFNLEVLNLQQTNIVTLPIEIVYCEALAELLLWGNSMESLPETMLELHKLHTMKINNRSFAQLVVQDAYMENLLSKGQIQSEHIPQVLYEIPQLERIDLEECLINNIPQKCQTSLKEFLLQKNFFHSFPSAILEMVNMRTLNLSSNFLTEIPTAIDSLVNIETLKFDNNQIAKIPTTIKNLQNLIDFRVGNNKITKLLPEISELKNLRRLFVNQNKIKELPENISNLSLLETFDLTENELKSLPLDMFKMTGLKTAHTYNHYEKSGLWLHKNPLKNPPEQIWKTENPQKIWTHLRRQQIIQTENLQRQKIIVLGDYQAGKTSFINALVLGKSVLTTSVKDSTAVMSERRWKTANNVEFIVLELGGDTNYRIIHPLFLDEKALYIIIYDHRFYNSSNFQRTIGQWIDMLQMHVPGAVVKIVGTQSDLCCDDFYAKNEESVKNDLENHLREHRTRVKTMRETAKSMMAEERSEGTTSGHSRKQLKVQKKKAEMIVKNQLKIVSNVTITHSNEGTPGIEDIINDLETMVINKNLFPDAQRVIPNHWTRFRAKLNMHPGRYVTMDTVRQLAHNFQITDPKELQASLQFFRDTGDIIWFAKSPTLQDIVFHVPGYLVELIQCLYRHDLKDYMDYETNRVFNSRGMFNSETFDQAKEDFFQSGQISRPLLRCLWFYVKITYDEFADMVQLVPKLDLFYYIPQPDIPSSHSYREALVVMPWYNKDVQPKDISDLWPDKVPNSQTEMRIKYTFPVHYPESIFEKFSVRLQSHIISRIDWQDMLYATTEGESILVQRSLDTKTYDLQIIISVRGELEAGRALIGQLYSHMKQILEALHGLLWVERFEISNTSSPLEVCFPQEIVQL
ncbi:malignant fibrous histiocytoma-amplified sequence 1 homolog [Lineus longissimus]|uniref:malignant fibrous histiocytoma-amplified sequence 1 homolog n=1 Tax=Lineus longissimus TaxID=88925 RepID=UPI002B4C3E8B